ncbi:hypothetical protein ACFL03_11670 [Thermodesulfobacteriota bacterium]
MSEPFSECIKCGNNMVRVSEENASPLIVKCQKCGHREYAEVQIPPPWPAESGTATATDDPPKPNETERKFRLFDLSAMPVTVGSPDDESQVVPVGWILLWIIVIALVGLSLWIIL